LLGVANGGFWLPRPQGGLPDVTGPLGGAFLIPRPLAEEPHFAPAEESAERQLYITLDPILGAASDALGAGKASSVARVPPARPPMSTETPERSTATVAPPCLGPRSGSRAGRPSPSQAWPAGPRGAGHWPAQAAATSGCGPRNSTATSG
jgi:hypothetical protein